MRRVAGDRDIAAMPDLCGINTGTLLFYSVRMAWWQAALWALAGGFVMEGLEFSALWRRHRRWPWQIDADAADTAGGGAAGPLGYFLAELARLAAGGILGAALAGQVTGPLPALAIGAAAPAIAGRLAAYVPLPEVSPELAPATSPTSGPAVRNGQAPRPSAPQLIQQHEPESSSSPVPERREAP
jgi:hypothetical protein